MTWIIMAITTKLVITTVMVLALATLPVSADLEKFPSLPELSEIPSTPELEFSAMADTSGELQVSRNSSYCNWKQSMGPICVYNDTNQVVVVPAGLTLPPGQLEVEIHLAKTVHVYPTCISWIQIFSAGMVTTLPSEEYYTVYKKRCRTWLRIYNSRADTIAHGVKDLTIINAQVNTINLVQQRDFMAINSSIKSIEALNWEGYRGTIQNTTIQRVSQVVAKDNLLIVGSHFGFVTSDGIVFKAKEMAVTNSSVSHIASQGMKIVNGAASFTNVTIDILETSAIVVKNPNAFLSLTNVTIINAFANCIILPDRERIAINNVTIKGVSLDISSPYLKFVDDFVVTEDVVTVQVEDQREGCSSSDTTLTCDFKSVNQSIELKAANIGGYHHVQIKNVKSLQVLSTNCNLDLHLLNVNGTLPHFATDSNHTTDTHSQNETTNVEECTMSLNVTGSKLEVISSRYISNMTLINSTVDRIHDGILEGFNVENVTVVTLDSVNTTGNGDSWKRFVVGSIYNLTLQAPLKAEHLLVTQRLRKGALTIDHPNDVSELANVKFSTLERGSIIVKRGKLILRDFVAIAINEEAIFVEEGASIELDNVVSFLTSYRTISVATRDQVTLNGTNTLATGMLVHIRNPPPPPDSNSNLTISAIHLSSYCSAVPFFLKVCDFSKLQNASVVVDLEGGQQSQRAVVRGASFVTLYPSCIEKLILLKVEGATTVDNEKECDTWLEAKGVHFKNITAGVHDVTLTSCVVDFLSPNRKLRDLDLEDTHVKWLAGVEWSGYTGLFNNSLLDKVEGLVASSRMIMSNTYIGQVLRRGMVVEMDGVITNSTINHVASGGIIVTGALRMKDVNISHLSKGAIIVRDGLLYLSNVSINSSEEFSITAAANGGVAMQNVTVGGKRVQWHGYLAEDLGPDDNSLMFINRYKDDKKKSVSSTPAPLIPGEPGRSTPESSSMTISVSPDEKKSVGTTPSDKISATQIDTSASWKWAGVGVGFSMALLLGCCVFLTVKVLKPNKGRLMPVVFWRVKDDQNELLTEDQPSEFSDSSRSGYQVVPGAEVI
ncbi:hypothetical protein SK128_008398 [Halocaridina rubra]|uniref:Uncharacterized protein n=1 Tax=Halocaridina rubra TaxID=373956 RepID=A0AAN8WSI2_HALRR